MVICDKVGYEDYSDGVKAIAHLNGKKQRHKYGLYKCNECGQFHITTVNKDVMRVPKRFGKYKLKVEEIKPKQKMVVNKQKGNKRPEKKQELSTGKMMTKEQAMMLKQLIESNKLKT